MEGSEQGMVDRLYREYGPAIYRRCVRLLKEREAARDATQEVFIKLVRDAKRLEDRATVLPWLYRVATNHCLNVRRDAGARGEDGDEKLQLELAAPAPGHAQFADRALVQSVLSRFDAATQAIAIGVFVDGMDQNEVAEALGVSRRTISRKLERFLQKAREYIDLEAMHAPKGRPPAGPPTPSPAAS